MKLSWLVLMPLSYSFAVAAQNGKLIVVREMIKTVLTLDKTANLR